MRFDQAANGYVVQHENYSIYPHVVPFNHLGVGLGERDATDPLILLLQSNGQNASPFLSRQAPIPPPIQVPAAMAATPGFGFQTPAFGADPVEQN